MCVYSMIADHYYDRWTQPPYQVPTHPPVNPYQYPTPNVPPQPWPQTLPYPWQQAPKMPLQTEIDEFYRLLKRAKEYDRKNNELDCGLEDKKKKLRELAEAWGIKLDLP